MADTTCQIENGSAAKLLTLTEVARLCNVPLYRARYAINTYGVQHVQRAGVIRLFHPDQLDTIRAALARTSEHGGRPRV